MTQVERAALSDERMADAAVELICDLGPSATTLTAVGLITSLSGLARFWTDYLWFESVGPDPELRALIGRAHARRRRDVEGWIEAGIAHGSIPPDVAKTVIAEQFCASIVGIVYSWLGAPLAHAEVRRLHDGLKQQMTLALT